MPFGIQNETTGGSKLATLSSLLARAAVVHQGVVIFIAY
jgi:hypothetical protein